MAAPTPEKKSGETTPVRAPHGTPATGRVTAPVTSPPSATER